MARPRHRGCASRSWIVFVAVVQEFFGVKVTVGAGLSMVEVGWGKPFGGAVFAFAGDPAPGGGQLVVGAAALGEFVDVGFLALGE